MGTVYFDCGELQELTCATVNLIARLKLEARRNGRELELTNASSELAGLISFLGLAPVLGLEPRGQAEEWEQPCCIEEEGELDDPSTL
jgi:hypothetical protein